MILGPGPMKNMNPVFSQDGAWLYFTRGTSTMDEVEMDVWRMRPAVGAPEPEQLSTQHLAINYLAPLDARTLLYVARAEDRSGPWLWAFDVERKVSQRVPAGIDQFTSVSTSRNGRRIVATVSNPSGGLWKVPVRDRLAVDQDAVPYPLTFPTGEALAPRFDGKSSLFYLSSRGTGDGLWKDDGRQAIDVWRGVDGALSEPPAVSRDGTRLVVVVRKEGKRRLMIMDADGTRAQTLAGSIEIDGAAGQSAADWSPDGKTIVAGGHDAKGPALFLIEVATGAHDPVDRRRLRQSCLVAEERFDHLRRCDRRSSGRSSSARSVGMARTFRCLKSWCGPADIVSCRTGRASCTCRASNHRSSGSSTSRPANSTRSCSLADRGAIRTFDITPDGQLDRVRPFASELEHRADRAAADAVMPHVEPMPLCPSHHRRGHRSRRGAAD